MLYRSVTAQIIRDLKFFPAVGIIGPRQAGKTTLARYIQTELTVDSIYLDLELESDRRKLDHAESFLKFHQNKSVIIDEVQKMPELFPQLRALIDIDRRAGRFILLGSASPNIIRNSSETLAGRIAYTELTPFSLLEVLSENCTMEDHWLKGGFPQAFLAPDLQYTFRWLKMFVDNFIYRDLQELGHQISSQILTKLVTMLAGINGNILNIADLSRSLGLSKPTVTKYLDLLEGGFVITRLQPYFINITKRLVKSPKLYIRDSGILHEIGRINNYDNLLGSSMVGASFEGYVIEQIRRVAGGDWSYYFYRTQKGAEIDLVLIAPAGKKVCIEIKLSNSTSPSRGFYEAIADIKPDHSFIIIPEGDTYPAGQNITICNVEYFLKIALQQLLDSNA